MLVWSHSYFVLWIPIQHDHYLFCPSSNQWKCLQSGYILPNTIIIFFLSTFLFPGTIKYSMFILNSLPQTWNQLFFQGSFYWRMLFRNQDLGSHVSTAYYSIVTSRSSQWRVKNLALLIHNIFSYLFNTSIH